MTTWVNSGNINWIGGAASAWNTIDTASGASQTTVTGQYAVTASMAYCTAFTLTNNNVITGVMLYCMQGTTPSTKTLSIKFSHDGGTTNDSTVTINCSQLPPNGSPGWCYFALSSPYTSGGTATNVIGLQASATTGAIVYGSSTTAAAIGHIVVTSTGSAANGGASDIFYCVTDLVSSAGWTVGMNNNTTTAFGNVYVCPFTTLAYTVGSGIELYIASGSYLYVYGTFTMGTSGTPITQGNTALLNFNGSNGITTYNGSIVYTFGAAKTQYLQLAADATNGNITVTLSGTPTNWNNGDTLGFSTTSTTYSQNEQKALSANVTTTSASIAALTYSHKGTGTYKSYVANYTRNVNISSTGTLNNIAAAGAIVNFQYTAFTNFSAPSNTGFTINTNTTNSGSFIMQYCTLQGSSGGAYAIILNNAGSPGPTVTFQYNNIWAGCSLFSTGATYQLQNLLIDTNIHLCADNTHGFYYTSYVPVTTSTTTGYGAYTNNVCVGGGTHLGFAMPFGTCTGNYWICAQSGNATATVIQIATAQQWVGTFSGNYFYNNGVLSLDLPYQPGYFNIANCNWSGNSTTNVNIGSGRGEFYNCTFDTGGFIQAGAATTMQDLYIIKCTSAAGTFITWNATEAACNIHVIDCSFSTLLSGQTNMHYGDTLNVQNYNQSAGDNRVYTMYGETKSDAVIYNSPQTQSQRCTPIAAASGSAIANLPTLGAYLESEHFKVMCNSGSTCTVSCNIRKSASGDSGGANYAGQAQIIVKRNISCGILADTVIATTSGTTYGSWQNWSGTLSGASITTTCDAILEFAVIVPYNASGGWVNVSDWLATS